MLLKKKNYHFYKLQIEYIVIIIYSWHIYVNKLFTTHNLSSYHINRIVLVIELRVYMQRTYRTIFY